MKNNKGEKKGLMKLYIFWKQKNNMWWVQREAQ